MFSKKYFNNLKLISEKVKPDIIIFASYWKPSKQKNESFKKRHNEIKLDLDKYDIDIKFESIESSYIRIG